jgi:hypothetical protein
MNERRAQGRRTATLVLVWLLAVGFGAGLAWFAVDRAGRAVLDPSVATQRLPVLAASTAPTVSASPTPAPPSPATSSPDTSSRPSSTVSQPSGPVAAAQPTAGGTVAVRCDGAAVKLSYATPRPGWSTQVRDAGPDEVRVRFERGGHGGEHTQIDIRATCTASSRPVFDVEQH